MDKKHVYMFMSFQFPTEKDSDFLIRAVLWEANTQNTEHRQNTKYSVQYTEHGNSHWWSFSSFSSFPSKVSISTTGWEQPRCFPDTFFSIFCIFWWRWTLNINITIAIAIAIAMIPSLLLSLQFSLPLTFGNLKFIGEVYMMFPIVKVQLEFPIEKQ